MVVCARTVSVIYIDPGKPPCDVNPEVPVVNADENNGGGKPVLGCITWPLGTSWDPFVLEWWLQYNKNQLCLLSTFVLNVMLVSFNSIWGCA